MQNYGGFTLGSINFGTPKPFPGESARQFFIEALKPVIGPDGQLRITSARIDTPTYAKSWAQLLKDVKLGVTAALKAELNAEFARVKAYNARLIKFRALADYDAINPPELATSARGRAKRAKLASALQSADEKLAATIVALDQAKAAAKTAVKHAKAFEKPPSSSLTSAAGKKAAYSRVSDFVKNIAMETDPELYEAITVQEGIEGRDRSTILHDLVQDLKRTYPEKYQAVYEGYYDRRQAQEQRLAEEYGAESPVGANPRFSAVASLFPELTAGKLSRRRYRY